MKAKRVLAMVLSVAMIATSGNYSLDVRAMENQPEQLVEIVEESEAEVLAETDVEAVEEGAVILATGDGEDIAVDSKYFALTSNGTLKWKTGVTLASITAKDITVEIPAETVKIPKGIFDNNTKMVAVTFPEDSALEEIEAGAFERSAVKTITNFPAGVTTIAAETFKSSKLQQIKFAADSELTVIGKEAFANSKLTGISLPASVTMVGEAAFSGCIEMTNVTLNKVQDIGIDAFKGCSKLETIGWSTTTLKSVGSYAFSGCAIDNLQWAESTWVANVSWGENVFEKNKSLGSVSFPDNMKSVPAGMFYDCSALTTVKLRNCEQIKSGAFEDCTSLKSVDIPASVTYIASRAFAGCQVLGEVVINQKGANGESTITLAEDAFPKKTMKMKGYDGTVEDYANIKGYEFITLFAIHTIKPQKGDNGSVKISPTKARAGETIEVMIIPDEGYRLNAKTFRYNEYAIETLKESDATSQTFTFVMPDDDVIVNVDFQKNSSYGTLSASFKQVDETVAYDWDATKKDLTLEQVGHACRLVVKGTQAVPGSWLFDYTSKDTKIAAIDSNGVIYARGVGKTTITAKLKSDEEKKVTFNVIVNSDVEIEDIALEFSGLKKAKHSIEEIDGTDFHVITYTKGNLAKSAKDFTVNLNITAEDSATNLMYASTWKVSNDALATVENESVSNNTNIIHVNKGAVGETAITVKIAVGRTPDKKVIYREESFILRIIDTTPRLVDTKLTVNSQCTVGTELKLLSVYGYDVVPSGLKIVKSVQDENITEYEESEYVVVKNVDDDLYLFLTEKGKEMLDKKGSVTYTNMYIEGEYSYDTGFGYETEVFRTAIPSLTLTKKALNPTIKVSGKINLFYSNSASDEEIGKVTLTQSLTSLKVVDYELVSAANYEKAGSEAVDSFANNFDIDEKGVITRSENELVTDSKNVVVNAGYLKILYEGYEPCYVKLTVPVQNAKPAYVLSMTKATVNSYSEGYALKLQLLDKKTKKAISLADLAELSFDESAKGTTTGLFEALDTEAAKESDEISLVIKKAQKGKAVINVEMETWNEPLKFTFNLNVVAKAPTVKAKPTTLTLNNICVGKEAATVLTLNQADVTLIDMDGTFKGKATMEADADQIHFDFEDGVLTASASSAIAKGSYKFNFVPTVAYANGETEDLKPISITVKVVETKLTATVKPSSVTLNNLYVGQGIGVANYTVKNLPVGSSPVIVSDNVETTGANAAAEAVKDAFKFSYGMNSKGPAIYVEQVESLKKVGSFKYKISGLATEVADDTVEIQPFYITVKVISKESKLTTKASGTLNISNPSSYVLYTLTTTNVNAPISSVEFKELDTTNGLNKPYEGGLVHFVDGGYTYNEIGGISGVKIYANEETALDAKKTYKIKIGVHLGGTDAIWGTEITIKPVQTLPKISADVTSATVYTGASLASGMRSADVKITKTTEKDAEIAEVIIASSNADSVKKAFKVSFDAETQKATIVLVRPDLVKANTEYSVKLEAKMIGQLANTTGPQVTLKVKVLN